jgi:hypothetical protein
MSGHDQRCEWSKTPVARCQCSCNGTQHGIKAVRQRVLGVDEAEENEQ